MLSVPKHVRLASACGSPPDASVITLTPEIARLRIDARWLLDVDKPEFKQDWDWLWGDEIAKRQMDPAFKALAISTADEEVQGAVAYTLGVRSVLEPTCFAVHIDLLGAAPRCRGAARKAPLYDDVGEQTALLPVIHSYELGLDGRVNLGALEGAERFYRRLGFEATGEMEQEEGEEQGRMVFELRPEKALEWMQRKGVLA